MFPDLNLEINLGAMSSTTSKVFDDGASATAIAFVVESQRRLMQRREMLVLQAASYAAGDIIHPREARLHPVVRTEGLEPSQPYGQGILSPFSTFPT